MPPGRRRPLATADPLCSKGGDTLFPDEPSPMIRLLREWTRAPVAEPPLPGPPAALARPVPAVIEVTPR